MKKGAEAEVHSTRIVKMPVRVVPVTSVPVKAEKTTFTRYDLPDGDFMMSYYFRRDRLGRLIPEDIENATHFERVVYDRDGNTLGSTHGWLTPRVRW